MISVDEALATVLGRVATIGVETVGLERAVSRILRAPVVADRDFPPFDRAAMDGFAVRSADAAAAGKRLSLAGEVRAGQEFTAVVGEQEAVRIMTGAPVPQGADAVIQVEKSREADGAVSFDVAATPGLNVVPRGAEAKAGTELIPTGLRLTASYAAVLASVGVSRPTVARKPRVAVIVTGDEVISPDATPEPAQIRNANGPALVAAIAEAGGEPLDLGIVKDDPAATRGAIERALASGIDALVLSGGVSAGNFDFVEGALQELGVQIHVTAVRVKPGAPFVFGTHGPTLIFGLPGNPVSAQVTFELFARPALLAMQGATAILRPRLEATLGQALHNRSGRRNYLPVRVRAEGSDLVATPIPTQGSGDVAAHAGANALAVLEPERTTALVGERVSLHPLSSFLEV